jgi:hypothetical protein
LESIGTIQVEYRQATRERGGKLYEEVNGNGYWGIRIPDFPYFSSPRA